jgi:hypothetical protein
MEHVHLPIGQSKGVNCWLTEAGPEGFIFAKFVRGNLAFGALSAESAGHKSLLGVIANEIGKNRVAPAPHTIAHSL